MDARRLVAISSGLTDGKEATGWQDSTTFEILPFKSDARALDLSAELRGEHPFTDSLIIDLQHGTMHASRAAGQVPV